MVDPTISYTKINGDKYVPKAFETKYGYKYRGPLARGGWNDQYN